MVFSQTSIRVGFERLGELEAWGTCSNAPGGIGEAFAMSFHDNHLRIRTLPFCEHTFLAGERKMESTP